MELKTGIYYFQAELKQNNRETYETIASHPLERNTEKRDGLGSDVDEDFETKLSKGIFKA